MHILINLRQIFIYKYMQTLQQDIVAAIQELPLKDRIKAASLFHYQKQWAESSAQLQKQLRILELQHFQKMLPVLK